MTTSCRPTRSSRARRARVRTRHRLPVHRRGQDRPRRATTPTRSSSPTGRRSACAARCTRATSASCGARCSTPSGGSAPGYDGSQDWDLVLRVTEQARTVHPRARGPLPLAGALDVGRARRDGQAVRAPGGPAGDPGPPAIASGCRTRSSSSKACPGSNRIRPRCARRRSCRSSSRRRARCGVVHGMRTNLVVHAVRSIVERTHVPELRDRRRRRRPTPRTRPSPSCARSPAIVCASSRSPGAFNYSAKINLGAFHARGEYLLMLNDDIEVLARGWKDRGLDDVGPSDWIECLLGYATHPDIGSVGAKMYFGDRRLQHVGIVSTSGSVPAHPYRGFHGGFLGYIGNAIMPCNYIAVTGACLMTRRAVFDEVGGMSAAFPINYQDVDYGLKLRAQGLSHRVQPRGRAVPLRELEPRAGRGGVGALRCSAPVGARSSPRIPTTTRASSSTTPTSCTRTTRTTAASSRSRRRPDAGRERPRRSRERAEPSALGPLQPPRRGRVDRGDRIDEQAFHQVLDLAGAPRGPAGAVARTPAT